MRTRRIFQSAIAMSMVFVVIPSARPAAALTAAETQKRMETVQAELAAIGGRLESAGHRLETALGSVVAHRQALEEAETRKQELRAIVSARAAQLYMLGTEAELVMGEELTKVAERLTYIEEIHRNSRALLEEIRALEAHATTVSGSLAAALADAEAAREELRTRRAEVSTRLADLSRMYRFLRSIDPRLALRASRGGGRGFLCPVVGPTGVRNDFGNYRPGGPHTGNDLEGTTGQPLRAVLSGKIVDTPRGGWIGVGVILRDLAGNEWWYAHLLSEDVSIGETVSAGEFIGRVGCSGTCYGSHLHFEYHPGGGAPADPYRILSAAC